MSNFINFSCHPTSNVLNWISIRGTCRMVREWCYFLKEALCQVGMNCSVVLLVKPSHCHTDDGLQSWGRPAVWTCCSIEGKSLGGHDGAPLRSVACRKHVRWDLLVTQVKPSGPWRFSSHQRIKLFSTVQCPVWCFRANSKQAFLCRWRRRGLSVADAVCWLWDCSWHQWWAYLSPGSSRVLTVDGQPIGSSSSGLAEFLWVYRLTFFYSKITLRIFYEVKNDRSYCVQPQQQRHAARGLGYPALQSDHF